MEKYNQSEPPSYNINKVSVPVAFYYGDNDVYCSKEVKMKFKLTFTLLAEIFLF